MKDIVINIKNNTRSVVLNTDILGVVGENLQGNFIVDFTKEFIDGFAFLECQLPDNTCGCIAMERDAEKGIYTVPVKSSLLKTAGTVALQIRVTQNGVNDEVPIFKSNIFKMIIEESINAEVEMPDEYAEWFDIANSKLAEMDQAIKKTEQATAELEAIKTNCETATAEANQKIEEINTAISNCETATAETQTATERVNNISADLEEKVAEDYYRGPQGPQGEDGPAGPRGDDGADGVSVISITAGTPIIKEDTTTTPITIVFSNDDHTTLNIVVQNGKQGPQGEQGAGAVVDAELSETSENAVQNKVIKAEFDKSIPTLIYDTSTGSTGTYSFLDDINNYNILYFCCYETEGTTYTYVPIPVDAFKRTESTYQVQIEMNCIGANRYMKLHYISATSFKISELAKMKLRRVYGAK